MGSNQTAGHDPDEITMEEFYRLLHISKRRAAWILQAGLVPGSPRTVFPAAGELFLHRWKTEKTCALCAPGGTDCGAYRPVERSSGAAGQCRGFGLYGICPLHCQQLGAYRKASRLPAPGKDCSRQVRPDCLSGGSGSGDPRWFYKSAEARFSASLRFRKFAGPGCV